MPTLAFWNICGSKRTEMIEALVREHDVDILVLAENPTSHHELCRVLNKNIDRLYFPDHGNSERLTLITRFQPDRFSLIRDTGDVAIRHYTLPLSDSIILVAVHLPSKLWKKTEDQVLSGTRVARYIREAEERLEHRRTIVIGDLNMNPFEAGVVGSEGLHAIVDRRVVAEGTRRVNGEDCHLFYNPMWNSFGDRDGTPPGTYYYNTGSEFNLYWNVFDQVLLRPYFLQFMEPNAVTVVTQLRGESLLSSQGIPNKQSFSDHLPIVCRLADLPGALTWPASISGAI